VASTAPRRFKWIPAIAVGIPLLCVLLLALILISACSVNKAIVAAGLPQPDSAFQTGTIYGYDVYLWECHQGRHIAVFRTSSEMTTGQFERQEVPCGELTPIEIQLADEPKRVRDPKRFW
jgi:hypothetical protein